MKTARITDSVPLSADRRTADVIKFPRKRLNDKRRAAMRLGELVRLSQYCIRHNLSTCDRSQWLYVLATTLAFAERREQPTNVSDRRDVALSGWPGLDFLSLADTARNAGIVDASDADIERAMRAALQHRAKNGPTLWAQAWLGQKLQLTSAVRDELAIRSIDACDETRAERLDRVKQRRREKDKETKRANRGRKPRAQYEAESLSRTKPWEAEGVSRATWYNRRKAGQEASLLEISSSKSKEESEAGSISTQPASPRRASGGRASGQRDSGAGRPRLRGPASAAGVLKDKRHDLDKCVGRHCKREDIGAPTHLSNRMRV